MNKQISLSLFAGVLATGAIAAYQPSAKAASFTAAEAVSAGCIGSVSCTVNGFSLTAAYTGNPPVQNRVITQKTVLDTTVFPNEVFLGLGVAKNANNLKSDISQGEIDANEALRVGFETAAILKSLDLSFLYQPGVHYDRVFEVALVTATGGAQSGTLRINGDTSAIWSDARGSVTNLSTSAQGGGGSYRIFNPFGTDLLTGFSLTAVRVLPDGTECGRNRACPSGSANSDFALSRVEVATEKVPEPAAMAGLGVVGLLAVARRRHATVKAD